jgi:fatty acid desaturase
MSQRPVGEWPTYVLLGACYSAFALATLYWSALPWWLLPLVGGYIVALHGGLQHEMIHCHPTRSPLVNEFLVLPSLMLWVPYRRYRSLHLTHHDNSRLTDPMEDPESFYLDPAAWSRLPAPLKRLMGFYNTLAGRLLIGPALNIARFWWREALQVRRGNAAVIGAWLMHVPAAALVIAWITLVCDMPLWVYALCFAYPGTSLILLRSYAEHRAHEDAQARTIVVETNPVLSLLYLNNNLHAAHHERPDLAWYRLPSFYAQNKARLLASNRNYHVSGYGMLVGAHLLHGKEPVAHPLRQLPPPQTQASR